MEVIASRLEARVPTWRPVLPVYKKRKKHKNTRQPRLEVLASGWRTGYQVGGQRCQLTRSTRSTRSTRQPRLEVIASGWRPGYQVQGQCYQVTRNTKKHKTAKVGGQSSGWRPKFRLKIPLQS